jgi:hypothetical protein
MALILKRINDLARQNPAGCGRVCNPGATGKAGIEVAQLAEKTMRSSGSLYAERQRILAFHHVHLF